MVGHDITKGDALFSPYRYRGQLYSVIYGQAIPSVIGQKSVALTPEVIEAMEEAKRISKDPKTKRYSSFSDAMEDLDGCSMN